MIKDKKTGENLPFSSIRLKNYSVGTISSETGEFQFLIPFDYSNDTLVVNHIGYEEFMVDLKSIRSFLKIELASKAIELNEAIISPLSAEDYIVRAVNRIKENYPKNPYQSISYYSEEISENANLLHKREGVFKSYYPQSNDTIKNQHQLLLYREPDDVKKFAFMRSWIEKKERQQRKKAEEEGKELPPEDNEMKIDLGGPETILSFDLCKALPAFLDTNQFKDFKYHIGGISTYQDKTLITINFQSKGKVDMDNSDVDMKQKGKVLIDLESDAFVMIEYSGKFIVPIIARPVLLALGLKIKDPIFSQTIKYESYKDKWYPKDFHWSANVKLTKRHIAKPKEYAEIEIAQVFFVSEIETDEASQLLQEKIFDPQKDMGEQVFNDINTNWDEINILKN